MIAEKWKQLFFILNGGSFLLAGCFGRFIVCLDPFLHLCLKNWESSKLQFHNIVFIMIVELRFQFSYIQVWNFIMKVTEHIRWFSMDTYSVALKNCAIQNPIWWSGRPGWNFNTTKIVFKYFLWPNFLYNLYFVIFSQIKAQNTPQLLFQKYCWQNMFFREKSPNPGRPDQPGPW